ncbi:MAG: ABC transporter [Rhodospirillaceae bacterium]|nr:ABC transporter [Rhodospirillaceae bacterium]
MANVRIEGVTKSFGEVEALRRVDLEIPDGEFLVLLGPSGCGKSTLMRIIVGLETATSGDVFIGNQLVNDLPPRERDIAMVFQDYALYPHLKVYDNLAFPLKTKKIASDEISKTIERVARMFELTSLLDRKPRQLSGGQQQRVALARAVVRDPVVFLMDEPLSNLDAKLRSAARDELKRLQRNVGVTTIFVTHDQVEALGMGDRIAVMDVGSVCQIGTPEQVYSYPANTFVATFLGTPPMNLIYCPEHILGFRPEHFQPKVLYGPEEDLAEFQYRVHRVEYLGNQRIVYGTLEGTMANMSGSDLVMSSLPDSVTYGRTLSDGKSYEFGVRREDLRFFDNDTEQGIESPSSGV